MPRSKVFTEKFASDYEKLDKGMKLRVDKAVQKIVEKPELGKPLTYGLAGLRSERIGKFRVIYEEKGNTIIFHLFEHRKKVYKK